jgi:FRG domain
MPKERCPVREITCRSLDELVAEVQKLQRPLHADGEMLWFRGAKEHGHGLLPSLMRITEGLSDEDHDQVEEDLFFEFQARATELRERGLTDWEYLFFSRHYGLPTRVLDWTDTLGVALYFALEGWENESGKDKLAIWVLNPYSLNQKTWELRDIILPRYLGWDEREDEYWEFGELLAAEGNWAWDGPVAIYPIQINDRVRAQRGWFTIHGNDRRALEHQFPREVTKIVLMPDCVASSREFLDLAGFNRFSIYPDLENLAKWLRDQHRTAAQRKRLHTGDRKQRRSARHR